MPVVCSGGMLKFRFDRYINCLQCPQLGGSPALGRLDTQIKLLFFFPLGSCLSLTLNKNSFTLKLYSIGYIKVDQIEQSDLSSRVRKFWRASLTETAQHGRWCLRGEMIETCI